MSKVSEVFQSTSNEDKCLIIYNDKSADSLIGAGILKYICENITDVAEEATNMISRQILQQMNTSILSSANSMQSIALSLLGG